MKFTSLLTLSVFIILIHSCHQQNQNTISYNDDIRPILNDKCLTCHGGIKQMGDFSLLFREDFLKTTESVSNKI